MFLEMFWFLFSCSWHSHEIANRFMFYPAQVHWLPWNSQGISQANISYSYCQFGFSFQHQWWEKVCWLCVSPFRTWYIRPNLWRKRLIRTRSQRRLSSQFSNIARLFTGVILREVWRSGCTLVFWFWSQHSRRLKYPSWRTEYIGAYCYCLKERSLPENSFTQH